MSCKYDSDSRADYIAKNKKEIYARMKKMSAPKGKKRPKAK